MVQRNEIKDEKYYHHQYFGRINNCISTRKHEKKKKLYADPSQ